MNGLKFLFSIPIVGVGIIVVRVQPVLAVEDHLLNNSLNNQNVVLPLNSVEINSVERLQGSYLTENNQEQITNNNSEVVMITPSADALLDVPATTVILQFLKGTEVELLVNGEPVDPELIGRTETSGDLVTQTWYGVPLAEGENILSVGTQEVGVFVRGAPREITVETIEARVPADGRSLATVRGQIKDEFGNLTQRDVMVTLAASAGEFVGADQDTDQLGFQVQAIEGEFTAQLRSPLDAQSVRIRAARAICSSARARARCSPCRCCAKGTSSARSR